MDDRESLSALKILDDRIRSVLYEFVVAERRPVSRDEAAAAVGISRSLASYHLDRLLAADLLEAVFARTSGRTGPGAGRPAKLYQRSSRQLDVTVPPRSYELAAKILLEAVAESDEAALAAVARSARRAGRELGTRGLDEALAGCGFEPAERGGATILCNCPFVALADRHREFTCRMNHAFVEGLLEGSRRSDLSAVLDPQPDLCCVRIEPVVSTDEAAVG